MIHDGEPPLPKVGDILLNLGLRVHGEAIPASDDVPDAITDIPAGQPRSTTYQVTGRNAGVRDFDMDQGRGITHVGVEFVVSVGALRFQVQSDGWADDVGPSLRVMVTGQLMVVGGYEWEDCELEDTRSSWLVQSIATADYGDVMLNLLPATCT